MKKSNKAIQSNKEQNGVCKTNGIHVDPGIYTHTTSTHLRHAQHATQHTL